MSVIGYWPLYPRGTIFNVFFQLNAALWTPNLTFYASFFQKTPKWVEISIKINPIYLIGPPGVHWMGKNTWFWAILPYNHIFWSFLVMLAYRTVKKSPQIKAVLPKSIYKHQKNYFEKSYLEVYSGDPPKMSIFIWKSSFVRLFTL